MPSGAWGWQHIHGSLRSKGSRIGWVEGEDLYLEAEAAHKVVWRMAQDSGSSFPLRTKMLSKRLDERGLLVTKERDRLLVRKTVEGARRRLLHLNAATLLETDQSDQSATPARGYISLRPDDAL